MLAAYNKYASLILQPSEVREWIVEDEVETLPLFHAKVWLRSIEPTIPIAVTVDAVMVVTNAALAFTGEYYSRVLDTTLAPEQSLWIELPISAINREYSRHKITFTNTSAVAPAFLHVLVNGAVESLALSPTQTRVMP